MSGIVTGAPTAPAAGLVAGGSQGGARALEHAESVTPDIALVVPRGAEETAVRRALARADSVLPVFVMDIGPLAAARAARDMLTGNVPARVLVTGLCGLLAPAFAVGEPLLYRETVSAMDRVAFDVEFSRYVAARVPGTLSGIRAFASGAVVTRAAEKRELGARFAAQTVDMETHAFARALGPAGAAVAALRIASDAVTEDLPDLNRALDGSGGIDGFALALALLRRPMAGARLARNGTRALRALEAAVYAFARASM